MKGRDREYVGRSARGRDAVASVTPMAERAEGGGWVTLADVRALFPKHGQIEVRGIFANSLKDGDWVAFGSVPNDRHGSPAGFRASAPRRLSFYLPAHGKPSMEDRRRLIVETGMEAGSPGDWVVQVSEDAFVQVRMHQCEDGRFRAAGPELSALPLWRLAPYQVVELEGDAAPFALFDHQNAEQSGGTVNWSRDDEYVRMIAAAIGPERRGPEVAALLSWALGQHADVLTGRVSTAAGGDVGILAEIERANILSKRLDEERGLLNLFKANLRADPTIREYLTQAVAEEAAAARPMLEGKVRAEVEEEMSAARTLAQEQLQALIRTMEADEMAALEQRCASEAARRDAEMAELRKRGEEEVAAATGARLAAVEAGIGDLEARRDALASDVEDLGVQQQALTAAVSTLAAEEKDKLETVERLVKAGADAAALRRPAMSLAMPLLSPGGTEEKVLALGDLAAADEDADMLSPAGMAAFLRIAVLLDAGEVPILHGADAGDMVDFTGMLLAAGRTAKLWADPTLITYDDLWVRAGAGNPTPLAAALASAGEGHSAVAAIERADRSGARFWYPQLADAVRRGQLPAPLLPMVTVDDPESEETATMAPAGFLVAAEGIFADGAAAVVPLLSAEMSSAPTTFARSGHPDPGEASKFLRKHGSGLRLSAARRFSRIHASAVAAMGEEEALRAFEALRRVPAAPAAESERRSGSHKPYLVGA